MPYLLAGFFAQKIPLMPLDLLPLTSSELMEIVVHAAKTAVKYTASDSAQGDPHVVLAIDCRNAFNCLGRRAIFNKTTSVFPSLSKFIFWAYGSATPIYASDGTFLFFIETGVKQGDPPGPLLFAAGLQDVFTRLH
jgi:hypothetical protein